jgi:hypothetical protein
VLVGEAQLRVRVGLEHKVVAQRSLAHLDSLDFMRGTAEHDHNGVFDVRGRRLVDDLDRLLGRLLRRLSGWRLGALNGVEHCAGAHNLCKKLDLALWRRARGARRGRA